MKTFASIAWLFVILVAIAHLVRALTNVQILIGDFTVPVSVSWIVFLVLLFIAAQMWRESRT